VFVLFFLFAESNCDAPAVLVTSKDVISLQEVGKVDVIDTADHPVVITEYHYSVS